MRFCIEEYSGIPEEAVREVLEERGHSIGQRSEDGKEFCRLRIENMSDECRTDYEVEKSGSDARILFADRLDFFHALGRLLSAINQNNIHIRGKGRQGSHGVLYDCSRNGVLRPEAVRRYIRLQALMGLKCVYLYTEDTYEIEKYPYFGALRGRYKREEIQECDKYAWLYGVELVPCIQTLAHLRTALRWPEMMSYRDDKDILMVGEKETYDLIEAMLESVKEMYGSRRIHLGMDEAWYLGYGKYRLKYGNAGQGELIKRHLDKVMALCKKHGFEPMIWSDMFFVRAGGGDYYGVPAEYEWPQSEKPDQDITLVYWDYYGHDPKRYERMAGLHRKLTEKVVFACGGWIWNGIAPNYAKAMSAMKNGFKGIKNSGIKDTFLTLWLDNGAETPMDAGLPMMAYYSREVYGENEGETKEEQEQNMEQWFRALTGSSWKEMLLLDKFDHIRGTSADNREFANPSKALFYQDVLTGIFDGDYEEGELTGYYGELADSLERSSGILSSYYALLARILAQKCDLGIRIRKAYLGGDTDRLRMIAQTELPELIGLVERLRKKREKIWYGEYKSNGYEVLDIRFSGVEARLRTAEERISGYLEGDIDMIEELEEERLPYAPGQRGCFSCNLWEHIVSAANIEGV